MTPETNIPQDVKTLAARAPQFLAAVKNVTSADEMEIAMVELSDIKAAEKQLTEKKKELLKPFKDGIDGINAFFQVPLDKLAEAKRAWDRGIITYRTEAQRLAAEENRRREEEVQKQQAQMRAQAAAEAARAAAQAAEKRRKAEEAANAGRAAQAAKLASQAESIESAAETKVAVLETTAASITAPSVEADVPKSEAGGFRKTYGAHVEDFEALVCAIAKGIESGSGFPSIALLKIDQANLNRQATALKEHFNLPGCVLDVKTGVVSR